MTTKKLAKLPSNQKVERTVKPVLNGHSQKTQNLVFKTNYCLMQVKSIAECSKWSILQYFRPSFRYHWSLRSLFCLFLSGHFTQVLQEGSGSVVECLTLDQGAMGLSLTGLTALRSWSKTHLS